MSTFVNIDYRTKVDTNYLETHKSPIIMMRLKCVIFMADGRNMCLLSGNGGSSTRCGTCTDHRQATF